MVHKIITKISMFYSVFFWLTIVTAEIAGKTENMQLRLNYGVSFDKILNLRFHTDSWTYTWELDDVTELEHFPFEIFECDVYNEPLFDILTSNMNPRDPYNNSMIDLLLDQQCGRLGILKDDMTSAYMTVNLSMKNLRETIHYFPTENIRSKRQIGELVTGILSLGMRGLNAYELSVIRRHIALLDDNIARSFANDRRLKEGLGSLANYTNNRLGILKQVLAQQARYITKLSERLLATGDRKLVSSVYSCLQKSTVGLQRPWDT